MFPALSVSVTTILSSVTANDPWSPWVLIAGIVSCFACMLTLAYVWAYCALQGDHRLPSVEAKTLSTRSDSGLCVLPTSNGRHDVNHEWAESMMGTQCGNSTALLDVHELRALNLLPASPSPDSPAPPTLTEHDQQRTRQSSASSTVSNASDVEDISDEQGEDRDVFDPAVVHGPVPTLRPRRVSGKNVLRMENNEFRVPKLLAACVALDTDPIVSQSVWSLPHTQALYRRWRQRIRSETCVPLPPEWVPIATPYLGGFPNTGAATLPMGASGMFLARNVYTWEVKTVHVFDENRVGKATLQQIEQFINSVSAGMADGCHHVALSTCKWLRLHPSGSQCLIQVADQYERAVLHVHPFCTTGNLGSMSVQPLLNVVPLWSAILDIGKAILSLPFLASYRSFFVVQAQTTSTDAARPRYKLALALQSRPMYSPVATRSPAQGLLIDVILPLMHLHDHSPTPALWERIQAQVPQAVTLSYLARDLWTSRDATQAIQNAVTLAETSLMDLGVFPTSSILNMGAARSQIAADSMGPFDPNDLGDCCYDSDLSSAEFEDDDEPECDSDIASRFVQLRRKPPCNCGACPPCLRREAFEMAAAKGRRREGRRRKPSQGHDPNQHTVIDHNLKQLQDVKVDVKHPQAQQAENNLSDESASAPVSIKATDAKSDQRTALASAVAAGPTGFRRHPSLLRAVAGGLLSLAVDYVQNQIRSRIQADIDDDDPFSPLPFAQSTTPSSWTVSNSDSGSRQADTGPAISSATQLLTAQRNTQPKLHQALLKRGPRSKKSEKWVKVSRALPSRGPFETGAIVF